MGLLFEMYVGALGLLEPRSYTDAEHPSLPCVQLLLFTWSPAPPQLSTTVLLWIKPCIKRSLLLRVYKYKAAEQSSFFLSLFLSLSLSLFPSLCLYVQLRIATQVLSEKQTLTP